MLKYTLKKYEILSKRKEINELFFSGKSLFKYPLTMVYIVENQDHDKVSKILFSVTVPKRHIRKAVKRNLIKRRIREAYRLNKNKFYAKVPQGKQIKMMLIFVGKEPEKYAKIERALNAIFSNFR